MIRSYSSNIILRSSSSLNKKSYFLVSFPIASNRSYWPMFDYIFLSYCFLSENQVRLPRFVSIYERDNPTYTRNFANVSRASIY